MNIAPVQIRSGDGMPNFICQKCHTRLEDTHQFQSQIVHSEKTLQRYLEQLHAFDKKPKLGSSIQRPSEDPLIDNNVITEKCESSDSKDVFDLNVNWGEKGCENFNTTSKINDEMSLKYKIKDQLINDYSLNPTKCTDRTVESLSKGGEESRIIDIDDNKLVEDININWKVEEPSYFNSTCKSIEEMPLKFELKYEPMDDSLILTETIDDTIDDFSKEVSEISCEDTKVGFGHTSGNAACLRSSNVGEYLEKFEEGIKNTSAKHKKVTKLTSHQFKIKDSCSSRGCKKGSSKSRFLKSRNRARTSEKSYQCDVCEKCFTQLAHLKAHKLLHTGEKPYHCDVCEKCFTQLAHLKAHKLLHTGVKPYQCDVCEKCFTQLAQLKAHKLLHTGVKPYQCDVCNKCFTQSGSLNSHRLTHTGEKPYQCDVCKKCFTHSKTLNNHRLIHTGEKPYQCDVCEKCFTQLAHLKAHKLLHTGVKPYQCDVCNRSFTQSSHLKRHNLLHTHEKPYQCDVCKKCFTRSSNLKTHKLKHTVLLQPASTVQC